MKNKEEIVSLNKEILKNPIIKIYSKLEENKMNYIMSLDTKEKAQKHEERIALARFGQGNLRLLKQQIVKLLQLISEERVEQTDVDFSIRQIKKDSDILKISFLCTIIIALLAIIIFIILLSINGDISKIELPTVYGVSMLGIGYKYLYGIILLGAIVTTAISSAYSFLNNVTKTKAKYTTKTKRI